MANIIVDFREVGYHVRRCASPRDDIMHARFLGHVFPHEVGHEVHGFDTVQRRPALFRRAGSVRGNAIEAELGRLVSEGAGKRHFIAVAGMPMDNSIKPVEQSRPDHIYLSASSFFSWAAEEFYRAGDAALFNLIFYSDSSRY